MRLIDADALEKFIADGLNNPSKEEAFGHDAAEILAEMYALATVDAAPVRHGSWIGQGDGYADGEMVCDVWFCSECDHSIDDGTDAPEKLPNYCPNCGAKMDEEATQ